MLLGEEDQDYLCMYLMYLCTLTKRLREGTCSLEGERGRVVVIIEVKGGNQVSDHGCVQEGSGREEHGGV